MSVLEVIAGSVIAETDPDDPIVRVLEREVPAGTSQRWEFSMHERRLDDVIAALMSMRRLLDRRDAFVAGADWHRRAPDPDKHPDRYRPAGEEFAVAAREADADSVLRDVLLSGSEEVPR